MIGYSSDAAAEAARLYKEGSIRVPDGMEPLLRDVMEHCGNDPWSAYLGFVKYAGMAALDQGLDATTLYEILLKSCYVLNYLREEKEAKEFDEWMSAPAYRKGGE